MSSRVWVVTGTSSGLGLAVAQHALSQGDKVIATVRSLAKFPKELQEAGATPLILDLGASDEQIRKVAEEALGVYGYVDVLVNNAATNLTGVGPVEELPMDGIREQFQINLFGTIAFTQPFVQHFRLRRAGFIFNISSIGSIAIYPSWGAYGASKAALNVFSDALQKELTLYGVKVFTILPGYFPTNIWHSHAQSEDRIAAKPPPFASTAYTDPVTQGYDSINDIPRNCTAHGKIGDPVKFAARVFEIVTGTGLAQDVCVGEGDKRNWNRVPFGSDCGQLILNELDLITNNIRATQPLWVSTDVEPERLGLFT